MNKTWQRFAKWRLKRAGLRLECLQEEMGEIWDEIEVARSNNPGSLSSLHDYRISLQRKTDKAEQRQSFWAWAAGTAESGA